MKTALLFRGLAALLLVLSALPAMACGPEYYMAMTQFAAEAKVIVMLDPNDINPAHLPESEADDASIWMETPMTFLKGSVTDTAFTNYHFQWLVQDAQTQPGSKIFLMLIPVTRENRYVVRNLYNHAQIIPAAFVADYETRLRELLSLTAKNDLAAQWRWVIRGITEHEMDSPIWQDAHLTVSYSAYEGEYDYPDEGPIGLPLSRFPVDQRPVLGTYVTSQLAQHQGKALKGLYSTLLLSVKAGVKDLATPYNHYLRGALELYENNQKKGLTAAILEQQWRDSGEEYDYFPVDVCAVDVAKLVKRCQGATLSEIADANKSLLYLLRMRTEYPELFTSENIYNFWNMNNIISPLYSLIAPVTDSIPEEISSPIHALSMHLYEADPAPLLLETQAALRAFTLEVASTLDMCHDPYITALTGERNWWGCHQAEVKLETFVLAGAASASGDPALSIAAAPNPIAHSQCTLEWKTASEQPHVRLALVDANGREVWSQTHEQVRYATVQQAVLSLPANLAAGTYLLKVQYPDQEMEVKVLVE